MTHNDCPVVIGRLGRAFGISGWVKVNSYTTPKENILSFNPWLIQKNLVWEEVSLEASKVCANSILVKLPGCDTPEEARHFANLKIGIWQRQLPTLKDGEYYWSDLIGLNVVNKEGLNLGAVQDLIATGSNDVLVVIGKGRHLIPYLSSVVLKVDLVNMVILLDWPEEYLDAV